MIHEKEVKVYTAAIICVNDKWLCLYHKETSKWLFPGGKPLAGEKFLDCLKRECLEEIGITIREAKFYQSFVHTINDIEWLGLFYDVIKYEGIPLIKETNKHSALDWLSWDMMNLLSVAEQELKIVSSYRRAQ